MKILVIRLSSLGDVVLTALLVRRLRERFPEAQIDFVTNSSYRMLLDAIPGLDGRFDINGAEFDRYDVIIDLQNNLRSRRFVRKFNAEKVIRYHRPRINRFLRIHFPSLRKKLATPQHIARQYVQAATSLGVSDDGGRAVLVPPDEWLAASKKLLAENGLSGENLLLVAVGGRHKTKIWPVENWIELSAQAYANHFTEIAIIGSIGDVLAAEQIVKNATFRIVTLAGKTDTAELVGLIASAKLLVCGDSGPMHIAAGVGTPVVAIFGPTVQEFGFAPFTDKARVAEVSGLECRPCHPHGPEKCPLGHFRCMLDIAPELVLKKAIELTTRQIEQ